MTDLFGPASAAGAVTTRPNDKRAFGSPDTWFKDCSDPAIDDGTELGASFFNAVLANIRALARGNGTTAGATDIVTQDNADDSLLLKAVTHLIQRGQPAYSDDAGSDGAIVVTLSPVPKEYKKGMVIVVKAAATNSGATTLNANGLGAVNVLRQDGTALAQGDIVAAGMCAFSYDGSAFQLVWKNNSSILLSVPASYYVNSSIGNDSNDGLSPTVVGAHHGPFATLQRAAKAAGQWILNGVDISIYVADGSYAALNAPRMSGSGNVNWIGNASNPAAVVVTGVGAHAIQAQGNYHNFNGFKVQTTGTGSGLAAITNSSIVARNIEYGACAGAQNLAAYTSTIRLGGALKITGGSPGYVGNAGSFAYANNSGTIELINSVTPNSLTIVGNPTFSQGFVYSYGLSLCTMNFGSISGAATGPKYFATIASVINTLGGGASYLPGSSAGGVTDTSYYG